jgi:predicted P-loop ATPase/GTPase
MQEEEAKITLKNIEDDLEKLVNDIADEAIEDVMRDYENAASNSNSFSASTFNQIRKDRVAYNAATKVRK